MPSGVTTRMRGSSRWESVPVSVPWSCRLASSLMRSILPHGSGSVRAPVGRTDPWLVAYAVWLAPSGQVALRTTTGARRIETQASAPATSGTSSTGARICSHGMLMMTVLKSLPPPSV